jgi:hypothetical protein
LKLKLNQGTTLRVVFVVYSDCSASSSKRQSMHKQSLACAFSEQYLHSIIYLIIKSNNAFYEVIQRYKTQACGECYEDTDKNLF